MAEIKLGRGWEIAHVGHTWNQTAAAMFLQPAVNVVVRIGEIMLLAGAFQTAANATANSTLQILAGIMYAGLGAYLYMIFWRYIVMPLNRSVRVRGPAILLVLPLLGAMVWLFQFLSSQISDASKQLVLMC